LARHLGAINIAGEDVYSLLNTVADEVDALRHRDLRYQRQMSVMASELDHLRDGTFRIQITTELLKAMRNTLTEDAAQGFIDYGYDEPTDIQGQLTWTRPDSP
jgi:hypothetical protein